MQNGRGAHRALWSVSRHLLRVVEWDEGALPIGGALRWWDVFAARCRVDRGP